MTNKLGLSTPEMPDTGAGSTGFPSNVRRDLRTLADTAERRGGAFPTDPSVLGDGDKFYRTDLHATFEYHADSAVWVQLAQGSDDPTASLAAHRSQVPLDHADLGVTTAKLAAGAVTAAKLAAAAATDAVIGNRTVDQATAAADTGALGPLLSGIANLIKNIKGTADWKAPAPITLTATKAHADSPHETPTGSQGRVNTHAASTQGAHGVYWGGGAPTYTGQPIGALYRDTSSGHLYAVIAGVGWVRVGMSIKSIQRVALSMPSGNASGTIAISGVDITKAVLAHMGVAGGGTGGNQDSSTMVTVGMQLISATQIQVSRGNTGSALTVFAQVTEWE